MKLSDRAYKVLKYLCIIGFPTLNTLLLAVSKIWDLPLPMDKITQTITAVATAIGGFLCISTTEYYATASVEDEHQVIEND